MQNPQTWRAGRLLFVWPLTFDLSGMGVPTRTSRGPASIALGLIGARKHPYHVKVAIFGDDNSSRLSQSPFLWDYVARLFDFVAQKVASSKRRLGASL